jgi:nucleoid-associated protein YgaU
MSTTLRCLVVWTALTLGCGSAVTWSLSTAAYTSADRPGGAVTVLAGVALAACATWAWAVCTVVVVQALGGVRRPVRGVPAWIARVVLLTCGVVALGTAPAPADDPGLDGLPLPDRAVGPAEAGPARAARSPRRSPDAAAPTGHLVVRAGDSLWRLSAARLRPHATDAEVAAATRDLYALNRDAVGADPDLIHPGLHLRTPADREEQP